MRSDIRFSWPFFPCSFSLHGASAVPTPVAVCDVPARPTPCLLWRFRAWVVFFACIAVPVCYPKCLLFSPFVSFDMMPLPFRFSLSSLAFLTVVMGPYKQARRCRIVHGFGRIAPLVFGPFRGRSTWGWGWAICFRASCYSARAFAGLLLFLFPFRQRWIKG